MRKSFLLLLMTVLVLSLNPASTLLANGENVVNVYPLNILDSTTFEEVVVEIRVVEDENGHRVSQDPQVEATETLSGLYLYTFTYEDNTQLSGWGRQVQSWWFGIVLYAHHSLDLNDCRNGEPHWYAIENMCMSYAEEPPFVPSFIQQETTQATLWTESGQQTIDVVTDANAVTMGYQVPHVFAQTTMAGANYLTLVWPDGNYVTGWVEDFLGEGITHNGATTFTVSLEDCESDGGFIRYYNNSEVQYCYVPAPEAPMNVLAQLEFAPREWQDPLTYTVDGLRLHVDRQSTQDIIAYESGTFRYGGVDYLVYGNMVGGYFVRGGGNIWQVPDNSIRYIGRSYLFRDRGYQGGTYLQSEVTIEDGLVTFRQPHDALGELPRLTIPEEFVEMQTYEREGAETIVSIHWHYPQTLFEVLESNITLNSETLNFATPEGSWTLSIEYASPMPEYGILPIPSNWCSEWKLIYGDGICSQNPATFYVDNMGFNEEGYPYINADWNRVDHRDLGNSLVTWSEETLSVPTEDISSGWTVSSGQMGAFSSYGEGIRYEYQEGQHCIAIPDDGAFLPAWAYEGISMWIDELSPDGLLVTLHIEDYHTGEGWTEIHNLPTEVVGEGEEATCLFNEATLVQKLEAVDWIEWNTRGEYAYVEYDEVANASFVSISQTASMTTYSFVFAGRLSNWVWDNEGNRLLVQMDTENGSELKLINFLTGDLTLLNVPQPEGLYGE